MKNKTDAGKKISQITLVLILAVLAAGLIKTVFAPVDEIYYENRPAEKLIRPGVPEYLGGDFQDSVEKALADQVHFAIKSKKLYNIADFASARPVINALRKNYSGYIPYRDIIFFGDALVKSPKILRDEYWRLQFRADRINSFAEECPETEFYVYYIEHDVDIDFASGEKSGFAEYLSGLLNIGESRFSALTIDSFEQYRELFLKTDHHWNGRGADRGLREICEMLKVEPPVNEGEAISYANYHGTRAAGIEGLPKEDFTAEMYACPVMTITVNGNEVQDYGTVRSFADGELESVSYGAVYGSDAAEIVFDTGREGENLLVMGDSYDNAIIKPLAGAFAKTYCVDLRAYALDVDGNFDMASYVSEHDIDKVLFVGAFEYFSGVSM